MVTQWMDHAGIATQAKVQKKKLREQGVSRYDLGREKFIDQVWEWKEEYAGHIREQWAKWVYLWIIAVNASP